MPNLIGKYRATQRRIRACFAPYTAQICPVCPAPCCRKPTKVAEFDVLLANSCGCSLPSANRGVSHMVEAGLLALKGVKEAEGYLEPCDYLGNDGCVFPEDLRPYECVRYVCPSLKQEISPGKMRDLRELLHKFAVLHRQLLEIVTPRKKPRAT